MIARDFRRLLSSFFHSHFQFHTINIKSLPCILLSYDLTSLLPILFQTAHHVHCHIFSYHKHINHTFVYSAFSVSIPCVYMNTCMFKICVNDTYADRCACILSLCPFYGTPCLPITPSFTLITL